LKILGMEKSGIIADNHNILNTKTILLFKNMERIQYRPII